MDDDKIPIEQVLDAMYNPDGGLASLVARDYFRIHYASPEEQKRMAKQDKRDTILGIIFEVVFVASIVFLIIEALN